VTSQTLALSARGLEKSYKNLKAVNGVNLEVKIGQCVALLGPNGAGKTTTVEILEGLNSHDAGEVKIFGKDWRNSRKEIQEIMGVLLQETKLYKRFTAKETLNLFASFYKSHASVDEMLAKMQLTDKADTKLMALSGGQKQRVYMGCSLINNPKLLFLDEPTTGLDPQARHNVWDLLKEVKTAGCSILLTSHYMEEAEVLADYVYIMDQGKIIAEGTPRDLIRETCGEQLLRIEFDLSKKAELSSELNWLQDAIEIDGGLEISTVKATQQTIALVKVADTKGIAIKALQMRNCTLEDVFLKLTGRSIRDG